MRLIARARFRARAALLLAAVALLAPAPAEGGPTPAPQAGPARGVWLAGDLHVHTCYSHDAYCPPSDDNTGPDELYTLGRTVEEQFCDASRRGLDYLAITDHDDVRSQKDPGFGACGVLPLKGYEYSLRGHAQMLGGDEVYDKGDLSAQHVNALANRLRARGGVFQVNHPAEGSVRWPDDPDWRYGYDVVPDTVEVWNISTLWQPPAPSASSNDDAIRYWEGWLNRGHAVAATGGSDNHWKHTSAAQGPGQPTTWVFAESRTADAILEALRDGRTAISAQPPAFGGARVFLEADGDADGTFESMVGDAVPPGSLLRARVLGAPGALLRVLTPAGDAFPPVLVAGADFEHAFRLPAGTPWARAEVVQRDAQAERSAVCDAQLGDETTYCRNRVALLAMTSALFLGPRPPGGPAHPQP